MFGRDYTLCLRVALKRYEMTTCLARDCNREDQQWSVFAEVVGSAAVSRRYRPANTEMNRMIIKVV